MESSPKQTESQGHWASLVRALLIAMAVIGTVGVGSAVAMHYLAELWQGSF